MKCVSNPTFVSQAAFAGLLLKANLAPDQDRRPHFTAYFGDYKQVSPGYGDGVVLLQSLNKHEPPVVLEADNEIVRFTTTSLRDGDHFQKHGVWPWPDDLRPLFQEAWSRITHPQGWLSRIGVSMTNTAEAFDRIFNGHRPLNRNLTFEELVTETLGFRYGRQSGELETSRRRPLIDYDFQGLLGSKAKLLQLQRSLEQSQPQSVPVPPFEMLPEVKKRVTLPESVGAWLKDEKHLQLLRWLMQPENTKLLSWIQQPEHADLLRRIQALQKPETTQQ